MRSVTFAVRATAMVGLVAGLLAGSPTAAPVFASLDTTTFVVDSTDDLPDAVAGDGRCETAAATCSLRAAIKTANEQRGANRIEFAIPGAGIHQIDVASPLPDIADSDGPLTIDGYSQPGASANTAQDGSNAVLMVQIEAPNTMLPLTIRSAGNTIRGLSFFNARQQITIEGEAADGNRIIGNFIGTDAAGVYANDALSSGFGDNGVGVGVLLGADQNEIGTPALADRNVISGNGRWGLRINHVSTSGNFVQNNVIGLTPGLDADLFQGGIDVQWGASATLIGGDGPNERNIFGGGHSAVEFSHGAHHNMAIGNYIGTLADGSTVTSFSGNSRGVSFKDGAVDNFVARNVIAGNKTGVFHQHDYTGTNTFVENRVGVGLDGTSAPNTLRNVMLRGTDQLWIDNVFANQADQIHISDVEGGQAAFYIDTYTHANTIHQSQFYDTTNATPSALPVIDIVPVGLNANDVDDVDEGTQDLLNTPDIVGVGPGKIFGTACASCLVEVYVSGSLSADGTIDTTTGDIGIGLAWIGTAQVDATGAWSLGDSRLIAGRTASALTIDAIGNTSELPAGSTVPAVHTGVDGTPAPSLPRITVTTPAAPTRYVRPEPFACAFDAGLLTWTDAAASTYQVSSETDGIATYVASSTTNSLAVLSADEFAVRHTTGDVFFEAICPGAGAVVFECSVDNGVLSWPDLGFGTYYVKSTTAATTNFVGSTTGTSLSVDPADSYAVRHRANGSTIETTCAGPGLAVFECSADGGVLTWTDLGMGTYYIKATTAGSTAFIGSTTGMSFGVAPADSYAVRNRANGATIETSCAGPGLAVFECSVDNGLLSWTDAGASVYYLATVTGGVVTYLTSSTSTSLAVADAEGFRVRYRTNGTPTDAFCA